MIFRGWRRPAPSARQITGEVLGQAVAERAEARRSTLMRRIRNPAGRSGQARRTERPGAGRVADRLAQAGLDVRRDWLRSEAGRAYLAARLHPARHAAEAARSAARTLERKIKRADKRIDNGARMRTKLMAARKLGQATMVAPSQMRLGVGQAVREVDRRVVELVQTHGLAAQKAALDKVMALVRGHAPGLGPDR